MIKDFRGFVLVVGDLPDAFLEEFIKKSVALKTEYAIIYDESGTRKLYVKCRGKEAQLADMEAKGLVIFSSIGPGENLELIVRRLKKAGFKVEVAEDSYDASGCLEINYKTVFIGETEKVAARIKSIKGQKERFIEMNYFLAGSASGQKLKDIETYLKKRGVIYQVLPRVGSVFEMIEKEMDIFIYDISWKHYFGHAEPKTVIPYLN